MLWEILSGSALLMTIGLISAGSLLLGSRRWTQGGSEVTRQITRLLPQTQCAQCGYPGCTPYAEAITHGETINRCPPGGEDTIRALADLLGRDRLPPDDSCGTSQAPAVASIREEECIGCTLCIQACPVDAIIGTQQMMHTIITEECTGCELCVDPCPVDCIDIINIEVNEETTQPPLPEEQLHGEQPCIHCGLCMEVCPQHLAPQQLLLFSNSTTITQSLRLDDCIECHLCDQSCPSQIPLTEIFRSTKRLILDQTIAAAKAEYTELRFDLRQARLITSTDKIPKRPDKLEAAELLTSIKDGDGS